jgi:alanyl-tRNA synthetase
LTKSRLAILDNLTREEIRFARTVETGTAHLENLLSELHDQNKTILDGRKAFELYATYGLPFEISRDIAREHGLEVDEAAFRAAMDEHRIASGGGKAMGPIGGEDAEIWSNEIRNLQKEEKLPHEGIHYDPYQLLEVEGTVLALYNGGKFFDEIYPDDYVEVCFLKRLYVESGGQVSDTGIIMAKPDGRAISPEQ